MIFKVKLGNVDSSNLAPHVKHGVGSNGCLVEAFGIIHLGDLTDDGCSRDQD